MTINTRMTDFQPDLVLPERALPEIPEERSLYRNGAKRVVETLLVLLTSPVTLPLILLMALLVACDGNNPFFVQKRLGRNGKVFRIWKLRSMVVDAEQHLKAHLEQDPEARSQWDSTQKLKRDPRVTRVGRLLRKTSMDELPQLLNVLRGDMSLVGPRPHATHMKVEGNYYFEAVEHYRLRHRVKPGLTGWAQVNGSRGEVDTLDKAYRRVDLDLWYIDNWSITLDLKIIFKTVFGGFATLKAD